jgi:dephospho-CoA kinase
MTFVIGLTGSIGMGKSTTAKMFAELGCAVWDADAAVHRMYAKGGAAVEPIQAALPNAIVDGAVSREALKKLISDDPTILKTIEKIVHPLVAVDRFNFIENAKSDVVVLDIPLLFETGGNTRVDATVVVSAPAQVQQQRVLERGTMTLEQFNVIKSKQMPDDEKRKRADYVVQTDSVEHAREQVVAILADIERRKAHA